MATTLDSIVIDAVDPAATARWWAAALGWAAAPDGQDVAVRPPDGEPGLPLVVVEVQDADAGGSRVHLDLATDSPQHQEELVARLESLGARRTDIGQGDVDWVVLTAPDGTLLCVLEPRAAYARTGALAAVVVQAQDPRALARFWAAASGWGVVSSSQEFATLRPGGVEHGPWLELVATNDPKRAKNRLHLDVVPSPGSAGAAAEVERLIGLGAVPADVGQGAAAEGAVTWVVLADPEGNEFCVL